VSELPSGTVTLIFTDIEGTTRLVERLGEAYAEVEAAHRALLREAFERAGGIEVERVSDTLVFVFTRARAAIEGAVAGQRALAAHAWPGDVHVRVGMGVHTGEPIQAGDHYVGMDVNRAALLSELATGGQIVVSQATHELVQGNLPAEVKLHDLGAHRFQNVDRPERLYQVVTDDLTPAPLARRPARGLPAGTVTFLFSDVEGSTQLTRRLRDRWAELHATHRRLQREAFSAHGGQEVDTQGDSFFVAFARARDAVMAAAVAQQALARNPWPDGGAVRVRMGIHTGEPSVGEEGYLGLDVIRAARICSAGHGGQVLLSETTRALVAWDELDGIAVIDLGEHRLKAIEQPERVYQLVLAGLQTDFRPLSTGKAAVEEPMPLSGREDDLGAQAEAAVREFRASIEQTVAESLRGVPGVGGDFDVARAIREAGLPPTRRRFPLWMLGAAAALVLAALLVAILVAIWLLTR
jgi:class 3 adenylate cyclase